MRARSRLDELRAAPEEPPPPPADPARAVRSPSSARPKTVSEGCCVECSQPSPYVFPPLAVRLCESCERLPRYALVTADLARHAYALRDDELPARMARDGRRPSVPPVRMRSRGVRRCGEEARRVGEAVARGDLQEGRREHGTLEGIKHGHVPEAARERQAHRLVRRARRRGRLHGPFR